EHPRRRVTVDDASRAAYERLRPSRKQRCFCGDLRDCVLTSRGEKSIVRKARRGRGDANPTPTSNHRPSVAERLAAEQSTAFLPFPSTRTNSVGQRAPLLGGETRTARPLHPDQECAWRRPA